MDVACCYTTKSQFPGYTRNSTCTEVIMHHNNPQILNVKQIMCLTLILSMTLYVTGLFTVGVANYFEPLVQNIIYAVGRVPVIFTVLYFALKKD